MVEAGAERFRALAGDLARALSRCRFHSRISDRPITDNRLVEAEFAQALDEGKLLELAGSRSFARGEGYLEAGRVGGLEVGERSLFAEVEGSRRYRVELALSERGDLSYGCSCPMAASGAFCKHCVAVGLHVTREAPPAESTPSALDVVREHLGALDATALYSILIDEAERDDSLLERLRLRAAAGDSGDRTLAVYRAAIDRAVDPGDLIDYRGSFDYFARVGAAIDELDRLLANGRAAETVELVEQFLDALEEMGGMVDDSDGGLADALERLQRLHCDACERADLDGTALAERLFDRMMASDWEVFYDALRTHRAALGEAGRARYAELARAAWSEVPALAPGEERDFGTRFRITHVMELLAGEAGDVDLLAEVLSRDLSLPYSFLSVAEAYRDAGRDDDALEWAERGMEAFPERPDSRLVEFLAGTYAARGRDEEAVELAWREYEGRPGLDAFQDLKRFAEPAGDWDRRRRLALELIRERIEDAGELRSERGWGWSPYLDRTELVRIFLWEGDPESAWREAQEGGCADELWLELAVRRREEHPADAIAVYKRQVEREIARREKAGYRDAVALIDEIRKLLERTGRLAELPSYVAEVRAGHARKRNLLKLLDEYEAALEPASAADPR